MDAKKTVKRFINPNWIPIVVLMVIPFTFPLGLIIFLCATLPVLLRANRTVASLEELGLLDKVAAEMSSPTAKLFMDGRAICTEHFLICKNTGFVFTYNEIRWVYKHRFTQRLFLIPIKVTDSLYLATSSMKATQVVAMGKDKTDQIKNLILEIYTHNNTCLIGYTDENRAAYKAMRK